MLLPLFLFLALPARAIHPASDVDYQQIEEHLKEANEINAKIDNFINKLFLEINLQNPALTKEQARGRASEKAYRDPWVVEQVRQRSMIRQITIQETLAAYGIVSKDALGKPIKIIRKSAMPGPTRGHEVTWYPTVNEGEALKPTYTGQLYFTPRSWEAEKKNADGITLKLGFSFITENAFKGPADDPNNPNLYLPGPKHLAITLYHEYVHFEQSTIPGEWDAQLEVNAWMAERARSSAFGLTKAEQKAHQLQANHMIAELKKEILCEKGERKRADCWPNPNAGSHTAPLTNDEIQLIMHRIDKANTVLGYLIPGAERTQYPEQLKVHGRDNFLGSIADAEEIVMQEWTALELAKQRAREGLERAEAEKKRKALAEEAHQRRFETDPHWAALKEWTHEACRYVQTPTFIKLHERWGVPMSEESKDHSTPWKGRDYLVTNFVVMPRDDMAEFLGKDKKITNCQRDMVRLILQAQGPMSAEWLVGRLDELRGGGTAGAMVNTIDGAISTMGDLADAIARGFADLVDGLRTPFVGGAAEQARARQSSSNNNSGTSYTPSRHTITEGPTLRYLSGIASGGGWK